MVSFCLYCLALPFEIEQPRSSPRSNRNLLIYHLLKPRDLDELILGPLIWSRDTAQQMPCSDSYGNRNASSIGNKEKEKSNMYNILISISLACLKELSHSLSIFETYRLNFLSLPFVSRAFSLLIQLFQFTLSDQSFKPTRQDRKVVWVD